MADFLFDNNLISRDNQSAKYSKRTLMNEQLSSIAARRTNSLRLSPLSLIVRTVLVLLLGIQSLRAGHATWSQNPSSGNWNDSTNWTPATVPNGPADSATFDTSNVTAISISSLIGVGTVIFNPGASAFTIFSNLANGDAVIIGGFGIYNVSGLPQNFVTNTTNGLGGILFSNNATAGFSTIFTNEGGDGTWPNGFILIRTGIGFFDSSTAGNATFINKAGSSPDAFGGFMIFDDNSTAGHGVFINKGAGTDMGGGGVSFFGNASADFGVFFNEGMTGSSPDNNNDDPGYTNFGTTSTAGEAALINRGGTVNAARGGLTVFQLSSTAGNCTVISEAGEVPGAGGGATYFIMGANAGNATVISGGGVGKGGEIHFGDNSTGGTARFEVFDDSFLDISSRNVPGVTIGSLEGNGNVFLGSNNLTVGTRETRTNFSGVIHDGDPLGGGGVGGSLTKVGNARLLLSGANTYTGPTVVNAGELQVDGSVTGEITVNSAATLRGFGNTGNVRVNGAGTVAPGDQRTLHINGNYSQSSSGTLQIDIAGSNSTAYGHVEVDGNAALDGTLIIRFLGGFLPATGQVFELLHVTGTVTGSFAQIAFPNLKPGFQFRAEFINGTFTITALNDGIAANALLNISARVEVGAADNVLISGFIIKGNALKKVIIRAIGPSLTVGGGALPGRLADPALELRNRVNGLVFSNDNWVDSPQAQQIIDSGIPPSNDHEAAIVATLSPGTYTAVMRGVNNTSGIGVVEVYDLAQDVSASLPNLSSRGFVDAGDNVMIGGFIVGNQPSQLIVRAIGPSLTQFGITNALADPTLELHNGNGAIIAFNDDWQDSDRAAIEDTGLPPSNNNESAITATLAPGNYTAIIRGRDNGTGVGLVEIYNLQ
jgi:autotransporter-associated beta strand protein